MVKLFERSRLAERNLYGKDSRQEENRCSHARQKLFTRSRKIVGSFSLFASSSTPLISPLLVYFHRLSSHHGATQPAAVRELLVFAGRRPARVAVLNDSKPVSTRTAHTHTHIRVPLLLELDTPRSSATCNPRHRKFWCRCSPRCVSIVSRSPAAGKIFERGVVLSLASR